MPSLALLNEINWSFIDVTMSGCRTEAQRLYVPLHKQSSEVCDRGGVDNAEQSGRVSQGILGI
jgi:hypothetical protein